MYDSKDFCKRLLQKQQRKNSACLFTNAINFIIFSSAKDLASLKLIDKLVSICSINKRDYVRLLLHVFFKRRKNTFL